MNIEFLWDILYNNLDTFLQGGENVEIKYEVDDSKVSSFTVEAKAKLIDHSRQHTLEIISEAEKVEASLHENGATSEITGNMIFQAARKIRNYPIKKYKWVIVLLRIVSELLLFIAGCLFSQESFAKDPVQFYWFCGVFFVAAILTIALHFKEGE